MSCKNCILTTEPFIFAMDVLARFGNIIQELGELGAYKLYAFKYAVFQFLNSIQLGRTA